MTERDLSSPKERENGGLPLQRRDLLAYESILRDDVARVLPFEAHALYFPTADEVPEPVWIAEEEKLLLPLRTGGDFLGVLLLRRPDPAVVESLFPCLPGLVDLCLGKLALYKRGRADALTGLATREVLLESLARELINVRRAFAGPDWESDAGRTGSDALAGAASESFSWQSSAGLVILRAAGLREASRSHGHALAERLLKDLGAALREALPGEVLAARTGDAEFAALLPGASRQSAEETARAMVRALDGVRLISPLTGTPIRAVCRAGYALFPQDWSGARLPADAAGSEGGRELEEAADLLDKARLAALRAGEVNDDPVMGYGSLLPRGGIIDQVLPLSRVRTTLGRDVGAREGQRFSVWSLDYPVQRRDAAPEAEPEAAREPLYKGEIVLSDVREDFSQADILLLGDSAWPLAPGDRLALLPDDYGAPSAEPGESGTSGRPDPLTGLYRHGDFLARLAVARERHPRFGLVLVRFESVSPDRGGRPCRGEHDVEHGMAEAASCLRRLLAERFADEARDDLFAGRYSLNGVLIFHPDLDVETAAGLYPDISAELARQTGVSAAMGIVCLPWLSYRASDALECCRKALDYALLLPEPHVGVFDSLAINISADRRYSQGDVFGAMEEYRLALLADENNTLAWNSLGVCLAGLGRHAEARHAFEEAVTRGPEDPAARYNLGTACATLGDAAAAADQFDACLRLDPSHLYARIRLGELAEARDDMTSARRHYEAAGELDPSSPQPHRCLARLEFRAGRPDKARERLHQALLRHPHDPFSLHMLARLYLDGGEDAELAETLARQSVALRPDRKGAWLELARALEAQGRHREAREVRVRAAEM